MQFDVKTLSSYRLNRAKEDWRLPSATISQDFIRLR